MVRVNNVREQTRYFLYNLFQIYIFIFILFYVFSTYLFSIFFLFRFLYYIHNARGTNGLAIVPNVPLAAPPPYPSKRFLKVEKLTLFIPIVFVEVESAFTFFHFVSIDSPYGARTNKLVPTFGCRVLIF